MDEKVKEPQLEQGVLTLERPYDIGDGVVSFRGVDVLTFGIAVSVSSAVVIRSALNNAFQRGFSEGATTVLKALSNVKKETVNEGTTGEEDKRSQGADKSD